MKISELMLLAMLEAGGTVDYLQFNEWTNQMQSAGLLQYDCRRENGKLQHYLVLTPKGQAAAQKAREKLNDETKPND